MTVAATNEVYIFDSCDHTNQAIAEVRSVDFTRGLPMVVYPGPGQMHTMIQPREPTTGQGWVRYKQGNSISDAEPVAT
jgi:hypothetical protein